MPWRFVRNLFLTMGSLAVLTITAPLQIQADQSEIGERNPRTSLASAVDVIRPAILQITFFAQDLSDELKIQLGRSSYSAPLGTAFFVNSDAYVVTANHVLDGLKSFANFPAKSKRLLVGIALPLAEQMKANFTFVDFDVIETDSRHDLALLKLKKNPFKGEVGSGLAINGKPIEVPVKTAIPLLQRPKDGEIIGVSGYPLGNPVLVTKGGWMATSWAYDIEMTPVAGAPQGFQHPDIADVYLADINVNPGNSGSPVYTAGDAKVVGVAVATQQMAIDVRDEHNNPIPGSRPNLLYSSGITQVVPTKYIIDLLERHGLKWQE